MPPLGSLTSALNARPDFSDVCGCDFEQHGLNLPILEQALAAYCSNRRGPRHALFQTFPPARDSWLARRQDQETGHVPRMGSASRMISQGQLIEHTGIVTI